MFLEPGRTYEMPIAHGEGRVVFSDPGVVESLTASDQCALRYEAPADEGASDGADAPYNPNGSMSDIAGLCDGSGRVLGLMPHPDRFIDWVQHPRWTSLPKRECGDGLAVFEAAVRYLS